MEYSLYYLLRCPVEFVITSIAISQCFYKWVSVLLAVCRHAWFNFFSLQMFERKENAHTSYTSLILTMHFSEKHWMYCKHNYSLFTRKTPKGTFTRLKRFSEPQRPRQVVSHSESSNRENSLCCTSFLLPIYFSSHFPSISTLSTSHHKDRKCQYRWLCQKT